jgi:UMF1 family MFS transporter
MNILSLYFKRWVVEDLGRDGLYYDVAFSASMLLSGIIMPALGAISDRGRKKKLFLFLFTLSCCILIGIIPLIPASLFFIIIALFGLSNFFYEGGMVFYNSLLYSVSDGRQARLVSGFGVALGYVGAIVGMILVLPWVKGEIFGLNISFMEGSGKTGAFLPTAILFLLFALPTFFWVKEKRVILNQGRIKIIKAYKEVWQTIKDTRKYPGVLRFLIADYFFEDAVATMILNIGLYSSLVLGFSDENLTIFLIVSTISAVIGSYLIGRIAQDISLKKLMTGIIYGWIITLVMFLMFENRMVIYVLGSVIGVLLGGLWTVSRPLLAEMVPRNELGRFFGLYSLSGRAAAVIGPLIWGVTVYLFSASRKPGLILTETFGLSDVAAVKLPYQLAIVSLIIMMVIGLFIFRKLPANKGN